jgi:PPOX class probable F420-dependent enzyme
MNELQQPTITSAVRRILDGPHLTVLATTDPDGKPQTSVIFVKLDGDQLVFSTIKGRRKTLNLQRDPRANLLVHALPVTGPDYATITGTVEIIDDPEGAFHQEMYDIFMGGATPPPEPGAERVIVRLSPTRVYVPSW